MKLFNDLKKKFNERKMTKSNLMLFENALMLHEPQMKRHPYNQYLNPVQYFQEFALSMNMGRQFGHTTFIKQRMGRDPNSILFYEKSSYTKNLFGDKLFRDYVNKKRIIGVNSNTRGIKIGKDCEVLTILIDRGSYQKSNNSIISEIWNNHMTSLPTPDKIRFVILG